MASFDATVFCESAASLILDHPGTVLIATGFYIPAGAAPETDGPPGAVALARRVRVALESAGVELGPFA